MSKLIVVLALEVALLVRGDNVDVKEHGESLPVTSKFGTAHICPVSQYFAWTAKHVVYRQNFFTWQEDYSDVMLANRTMCKPVLTSQLFDLALVACNKPLPYFFPINPGELTKDDEVWVTGYDEEDSTAKTIKTKIIGFRPGLFLYRKSPGLGSSGACVLNWKNEIVGVNFAVSLDRLQGLAVKSTEEDVLAVQTLNKEREEK